jgi:hypothetical protein
MGLRDRRMERKMDYRDESDNGSKMEMEII